MIKLIIALVFALLTFSFAMADEGQDYLNLLTNHMTASYDPAVYYRRNTPYPVPLKVDLHFSCAKACDQHNLSTICQADVFADLSNKILGYEYKFKSHDEMKDYFYSYRHACKEEAHSNYVNQYEEYISIAAKSFGVPEVLLSCLLFKENQFLSKRKSSAKAAGISQFMPVTIAHVSNILDMKYKDTTVEKFYSIVSEFSEDKALELSPSKRPQYYRDYEYSRRVVKNHVLQKQWFSYIDSLKLSNTFIKNYPSPPWKDDYPTYFDSERADIPPLAIGASALYLKDIIAQMTLGLKGTLKSNSQKELLDFLTAISGAYNMGPGEAQRKLGSPPPESAAEWVAKLRATNPESKAHMDSIRNCMERNNTQPPILTNGKGQNICRK